MNILEIKDLTKLYKNNRGIENINLVIKPGEIVGFIGPNGAGKSTTIRTILGLIKRQKGSVSILGNDIDTNLTEVKNEIGYLPSEVFYYSGMKAKDLLNYSASFYKVDCKDRIKELAQYFELDLNMKIDKMSLGNKKKVGIIQGLIHSPKFIILDEPTSGLDPLMQKKFFNLLKEENKKGATILFSSHILSEVEDICSRVVIIKDGKIIDDKSMEETESSKYKKIKLIFKDENFDSDMFKGEKKLEIVGNKVSFIFEGNIIEELKKVANYNLIDIEITEPNLEEIFLHFYE